MSFYVTLPSNIKTPNNSISNFVTRLGQRFHLDESWVVALAEISYTKSWYNVLYEHKISLRDEIGNIYSLNNCQVSPGFYPTAEELIDSINEQIQQSKKFNNLPNIEYNKYSNRVIIQSGIHPETQRFIYPNLGKEIEDILGLREDIVKTYYDVLDPDVSITTVFDNKLYVEGIERSLRPVEITAGYRSLYVYCNIIEPTFIGDTCAQVIRVVEVPDKPFGKQCVLKYDTLYYHRLMCKEFESIEISIKDDTGNNVPFSFGRAILVLHFKKL